MLNKTRKEISDLINDTDLLKLLELLAQQGVEFSSHLFDGDYNLNTHDIIEFINDKEAFEAKVHNVDLITWKKYTTFITNHRCCEIITKNGKQCKNHSTAYDLCSFVSDGLRGICEFHKKLI